MISHSHNHNHRSCREKMQKCQEYVEALEEESRKIQVFQRELPLCVELVAQAIKACKQQLSGTTTDYFNGQSECSEQTSSEGPAFEQFIPIKSDYSDDDNDEEEQSHEPKINNTSNNNDNNQDKCSNKSDWLRSVQLWNQTTDPPTKEDSPRKGLKRNGGGGAFHPFKREKIVGATTTTTTTDKLPSLVLAASVSSSGCSGGSRKEEKEEHSQRKMRRCWSPELHRQFLHALQQIGGSHVATPKQIRELMKVDGLTNDEVKSHLQKYRLNTRRPSSFPSNTNPQAPQFVVVGGIWVPPPEYSAVATTAGTTAAGGEATGVATSKGIYTPIAAPPPGPPRLPQTAASQTQRQQSKQSKQLHSDERPNHSEDGVHSNSPATSSCTHTTTSSPVF